MKPNFRIFVIYLTLLGWGAFNNSAEAHGPRYTNLATSARIAEDPNSEWTAADVAAGKYDSLFSQINDPIPNLNFTTSTWWVVFSITNGTRIQNDYYIETARPLTNEVNLYRIYQQKANLLFEAGDEQVFTDRPAVYRRFVFPITLRSQDTMDLLLQVRSDGEVITLPIKLWEKDNFNGFIQRENLTLGIYYGLLIFVAGLFLFFAFVAKQRIYIYYVSYVIFLLFMQASLDGLAFEYVWPQSTWLANHSILFFSGASVFMIMLYAAEFLQIQFMPTWYRYTYRSLVAVVVLCIVGGLTNGITYQLTYPLINGMSLLSLIIIIVGIGWNQHFKKNVNFFFALGFIAILIGGIIFILTNFNLIYSDFLSQNAIKLGSAAEITFLSLAMVSRYRDILREKEIAQKEAFENLEKLTEVTKQQNIVLEQQVAERTIDLQIKSEELEEKNKEIIDSITYAKRIQEAILPTTQLFNRLVPNSFVLYLPKDIVAGDFYWLESSVQASDFQKAPDSKDIHPKVNSKPSGDEELHKDEVVLFAAADCTGHGVPGAMVSVICHNALNRAVREFQLKLPGEILDKTALIVDETFEKSNIEVKDGMDISLCAFHKESKRLEWAGANNPLWIITERELTELGTPTLEENGYNLYEIKGDKQPIGRFPNRFLYHTHHIQLQEGDHFYVFTDGYPDQFGGEKGKKYKSLNLKHFLLQIQEHTIEEQKHLLHYEFNHWREDLEQIDDVCIIGVRV